MTRWPPSSGATPGRSSSPRGAPRRPTSPCSGPSTRPGASAARRCCCARPWSTRRCSRRPGPRRRAGVDTRVLPVDGAGRLDLDALAKALSSRSTLVAVMTANNETGVVQPLGDVVDASAAPRPAGVRVHRRRPGGAVPRPGRGGGGRGPGVAQRAQARRAGRCRCARGARARGPGGAPARWRPGARAAQRDPGRGGCGRARRRAAPGGGRARRRGRPCRGTPGPLRRRAGGVGAGGAAHGARRRRRPPRAPARVRARGRAARSCWSRSVGRGCACRAGRPAPAGPSSPATSWRPWASHPGWPGRAAASPWGLAPPMQTWTAPWAVVPGVVEALRRRA